MADLKRGRRRRPLPTLFASEFFFSKSPFSVQKACTCSSLCAFGINDDTLSLPPRLPLPHSRAWQQYINSFYLLTYLLRGGRSRHISRNVVHRAPATGTRSWGIVHRQSLWLAGMTQQRAAGDGLQAPASAAKYQLKMASTFKRLVIWRSVFLIFGTTVEA